jgi:predicted metal-dependent HD superfamily phosphohydrolase
METNYPADLHALWCADVGFHPDADQYLDGIWSGYRQADRRYHSTDHVTAVVHRVTALAHLVQPELTQTDLAILRLSAWFHDIIYDATRNDNEEQSALYAIDTLQSLDIPAEITQSVATYVRMTQHHQPTDDLGAIVSDADLWTLGGSPDDYFAYGSLVRAEYAHVNDEDWKNGRSSFIERFLTRPAIFYTSIGRAEREDQARRNLTEERARLLQ